MNEEYKTRIDAFFIIWPILILVMQTFIYVASMNYIDIVSFVIIGTISLVITVFLLGIATTRYIVTIDHILIKNLLFSKKITLSEIQAWNLCESSLNIYSASTKQIELVLDTKKIRISPINQKGFLEMLSAYKQVMCN